MYVIQAIFIVIFISEICFISIFYYQQDSLLLILKY
jgi:hypothetical protein